MSAAVCVAGWLCIYFAEVSIFYSLMSFVIFNHKAINPPETLPDNLFYMLSITKGGCSFGHWKAGYRICNGSLFLCGAYLFSLPCNLINAIWYKNYTSKFGDIPYYEFFNACINNFDTMHDKVPVFIAEIAPKNLRGALTTINQVNIYTRTNWRNTLLISSSEARNIFS